jgi:hypothetical protein
LSGSSKIAEEKVAAFEAAMVRKAPGPSSSAPPLTIWEQSSCATPTSPASYLTIDRWASEDDFRAFRKDHDQEYEVLDRSCDSLTSRETRIGAYTV